MHLFISLSKICISDQNMNYKLNSGEVLLSVPSFEDKLAISADVVAARRMVRSCSLV